MVIKEWGRIKRGRSRSCLDKQALFTSMPSPSFHSKEPSPGTPTPSSSPNVHPQNDSSQGSTVFMLLFMCLIISPPYKCLFCTRSRARHSAWAILFHPHGSSQIDSYVHFTDEDMAAWRVKVTHSWWWYWNSIRGCLTAKIQLFPPIIHLLIRFTHLFFTLAHVLAIVLEMQK